MRPSATWMKAAISMIGLNQASATTSPHRWRLTLNRSSSLRGIHVQHFSFHRVLSNRFPFGIYYLVEEEFISVYAVLELRRDPAWIRQRLGF